MFLSLCNFVFEFNVFKCELLLMATFIPSLKKTLSFLPISAVISEINMTALLSVLMAFYSSQILILVHHETAYVPLWKVKRMVDKPLSLYSHSKMSHRHRLKVNYSAGDQGHYCNDERRMSAGLPVRESVHFLPPDFIKRRFTGLSLEDHCCGGNRRKGDRGVQLH